MAIYQAEQYFGTADMFADNTGILHYCGTASQKAQMDVDLAKVLPNAVERLAGPSLNGIRDWWTFAKSMGVKNALEVGSAHGESAFEATGIIPDLKLTCIDPWEGRRYGNNAQTDFEIRHSWNPNVTTIRGYSPDALKVIPDGSLDAGYIDAMHTDPHITIDIDTLLPKIRKGGIIGGHDYIWKEWPDVVNAVNKKFGGPDMVFQDTSWLVVVK
jgi:hypothetical protein